MRVLDLYAGLGGTARGVQVALKEAGINDYEYLAVEKNWKIADAHKENNPKSQVLVGLAEDWLKGALLKTFDFIWASPPCMTHSRWNCVWNKRRKGFPEPDETLWEIIRLLRGLAVPFIVENVDPYYKPPINYTIKIGRHCFWSNLPLIHFDFVERPKAFDQMTWRDWKKYHLLLPPEGPAHFVRQTLRNATHWTIAKGLFEQFLEPRQHRLTAFLEAKR